MTEQHTPPRPISDAERRMWETTGDGVSPELVQPPQPERPDQFAVPDVAPPPARRDPDRPAILDHMVPSGLRQKYVVEMQDGTMYPVESGPPDVLRWEKTFKRGWFDETGVSFARLVFIAWAALKRTGVDVPNYPAFELGILDIHFTEPEEDGDPDPTPEDPGAFS